MNLKGHIFWSCLIMIILWILIPDITITSILVSIPFTIFPDIDHNFGSHRHFLPHSIILWIIVFIFNPSIITVMIVFGTGLHCLEDIKPRKMKGFALITYWKYKKLFKFKYSSTLWLLINFINSVIILGWWLALK